MITNQVKRNQIHHLTKHYGSCIFIDKLAIIDNLNVLKSSIPQDTRIAPVLKNDAYNLGINNVFPILRDHINEFFVATMEEAIILRNMDQSCQIYVLNVVSETRMDEILNYNITPIIGSLEQLYKINAFLVNLEKKLPCILQLETGMYRLGLTEKEVEIIHKDNTILEHIEIKFIMTHLASSKEEIAEAQYKQFQKLLKKLPFSKYSIWATSCINSDKKYQMDIIRPGIALYGGEAGAIDPLSYDHSHLKNAISVYTSILKIQTISAGDSVGYDHIWTAEKSSKIASIAMGYADGIPNTAVDNLSVFINNKPAPVVGKISMDITTIDITDLGDSITEDSMVEIIGPNFTLSQFSLKMDFVNCYSLNHLSRRYPRYVLID